MWTSWKFWAVWMIVLSLIILLSYGFTTDPKKVPSPLMGRLAPDFKVDELNGEQKFSLSEFKGMPIVLNFWASWCAECRIESVTLKSTVTNGFVAGTALGALFGFYMLQNAIVIPSDNTLPRNLDQLLGNDGLDRPIHRSIVSQLATQSSYSIKLNVFGFRF